MNKDEAIKAGKVGIPVPDVFGRLAHHVLGGMVAIHVAIGAGEDHYTPAGFRSDFSRRQRHPRTRFRRFP